MITKIDPEIIKKMREGTADDRKYIAGREFLYFAAYYFPQFFTHGIPDFHYEMYQDLKDLSDNKVKYLLWVMFRESAKTSFAKIYAIWCICFETKHYINFDSYDKGNSEAALLDIASALLTNQILIRDFGHLYRETRSAEKKTLKKMSEFITTNDIKVQAFSTQESTRGRLYKQYRPDLYIFDDVENDKTITSLPVIKKIKRHIREALAGMAGSANAIFLGNLLTEAGVIFNLIKRAENNPNFKYRRVDVEMEGKITWPQKYVRTVVEAYEINQKLREEAKAKGRELLREEEIISLDSKKKDLGKEGYATEMLNSPEAAGDLVFDRTVIKELIARADKPKEEIANLRIWFNFHASHRYGLGADIAKGVKRDHSALCIIDFSTTPNRVVATYKNNEIPPDQFAYEIKRGGEKYGECIVCPENNNHGYGTILQLKTIYDIGKIWRQNYGDKAVDKPTDYLGWEANAATVPDVIFQLKRAIEDGLLVVYDKGLLGEMKSYTRVHLTDINHETDDEEDEYDLSNHFDLLRACALAWKMKDYAEVSVKKESYKQQDYEGISDFEKPTVDLKPKNDKWNMDPFEGNPFDLSRD